MDGSQPGSTVPGILQARTLEWVAISFSSAWKWKVKVKLLSPILSDPMDCSLPGSSTHGICQARVLEWGAITFSGRGGEEYINRMYWVGQKFIWVFHHTVCKNPNELFGKPNISSKRRTKVYCHFFFFLININFWLGCYFQRKLVWNSGNFSVNQTYKIVCYLGNIILLWYWGRAHRQ